MKIPDRFPVPPFRLLSDSRTPSGVLGCLVHASPRGKGWLPQRWSRGEFDLALQRDLQLPLPASPSLAGLGGAEADPRPPFSVGFCVEYPALATLSRVAGPREGRAWNVRAPEGPLRWVGEGALCGGYSLGRRLWGIWGADGPCPQSSTGGRVRASRRVASSSATVPPQAVGAAACLEGWGGTRVSRSALAVRVSALSELRASERAGRVAPRICAWRVIRPPPQAYFVLRLGSPVKTSTFGIFGGKFVSVKLHSRLVLRWFWLRTFFRNLATRSGTRAEKGIFREKILKGISFWGILVSVHSRIFNDVLQYHV